MPVTIKSGNLKYKNSLGQYVGINCVSDSETADQIAAIEAAGEEVLESIPQDYSELVAEVGTKTDKVSSATNGNFAGLDGNGNLVDSGHKHSDYLTSHQDISGKLNKPATNGTDGQLLQTNGDGTTEWVTTGTPTDAQVGTAVEAWLDDHPEATTTVEDGAVTWAKLNENVHAYINDAYTIEAGDLESGTWGYSTKGANTKRLRIKNLIPVWKGMKVAFTNPTLQIYIGVLPTKTSSSYLQTTGWISTGSTERTVSINNDGWLVLICQSSVDITVADYDSVIRLVTTGISGLADTRKLADDLSLCRGARPRLPAVGFVHGGLYDASGIYYFSMSRSVSGFIPVVPGETIQIVVDSSAPTITVHEYAASTEPVSGSNTSIAHTELATGTAHRAVALNSQTNYIKVTLQALPENTNGRVYILSGKRYSGFTNTVALTVSDLVSGSVSSKGETTENPCRIHTRNPVHIHAGETFSFIPGTKITDFIAYRRFNQGVGYVVYESMDWTNAETDFTAQYDQDIIFIFAAADHDEEIEPDDFDCTLTVNTRVIFSDVVTYPSLNEMLKDESLQYGQVVYTQGFSWYGDGGGATYRIDKYGTVNNVTVFQTANDGCVAVRVFDTPFLYLESLNVGTASWSAINNAIVSSGICDIRCANITTPNTIELGNDYSFTFGTIEYTGADTALIIDGMIGRKVKGDKIIAPNAEFGVKLTTTSRECSRNIFEINEIFAKDNGFAIRPVNNKGLMYNTFRINYIESGVTGVSTYIPSETEKYSWEGESVYTLNEIKCTNASGTGIGVLLQIDPDPETGETVDGTITGLTYTNLAVEYSDIGMKILCGKYRLGTIYDACIKGINVLSMRVREVGRTKTFLTGSGYIRDLYIRPTSGILIDQWNIDTGAGEVSLHIDAPITPYYSIEVIGHGLTMRRNAKFITERLHRTYTVTKLVRDYSQYRVPHSERDPDTYDSEMIFPDCFRISESLRGQTVTLNLDLFGDESADGILYRLPGTLNGESVTVNATYMRPHKTITLTNNTPDEHIYRVDVKQDGGDFAGDVTFRVIDLGVPSGEETVAWDYDEDEDNV